MSRGLIIGLIFAGVIVLLIGFLVLDNYTQGNISQGTAHAEVVVSTMQNMGYLPWTTQANSYAIAWVMCDLLPDGTFGTVYEVRNEGKTFGPEISGCAYLHLKDVSIVASGDPWDTNPRVKFQRIR